MKQRRSRFGGALGYLLPTGARAGRDQGEVMAGDREASSRMHLCWKHHGQSCKKTLGLRDSAPLPTPYPAFWSLAPRQTSHCPSEPAESSRESEMGTRQQKWGRYLALHLCLVFTELPPCQECEMLAPCHTGPGVGTRGGGAWSPEVPGTVSPSPFPSSRQPEPPPPQMLRKVP